MSIQDKSAVVLGNAGSQSSHPRYSPEPCCVDEYDMREAQYALWNVSKSARLTGWTWPWAFRPYRSQFQKPCK